MNYEKHYSLLIERAKNRLLEDYCERHHVIPRCMDGTDDPQNLVDLTAEEHYVAHQLLVKMYPENYKLVTAANMMSGGKRRNNNKAYGWIRRRNAIAISNINKGVAKTEEHKRNISLGKKGKISGIMTEEKKAAISRGNLGKGGSKLKGKTYEEIYGVKEAKLQGMKRNAAKAGIARPIVTCPACNESGGAGAMHRWHFDNCKELAHV